jgi:hypothetical protein
MQKDGGRETIFGTDFDRCEPHSNSRLRATEAIQSRDEGVGRKQGGLPTLPARKDAPYNPCKGSNSSVLTGRFNAAFATVANVPMSSRPIGMRAAEVLAERVNPAK